MFPRLFPEVPEDLAALGDEELAALLESFRDVSRQLRAGEINLTEVFGEDVSAADASTEAMRQWQEAAETVRSFRAELESRAAAVAEFDTQAEELDAQFSDEDAGDAAAGDGGDDNGDDDDDTDADAGEDADTDADADPVSPEAAADGTEELAADGSPADDPAPAGEPAGEPAPARVVRFPAVPRNHQARETADGGNPVRLVAAGGFSGARIRAGEELTMLSYADAAIRLAKSLGRPKHYKGGGQETFIVASAEHVYPEERTLKAGDPEGNAEKIRAMGSYFLGEEAHANLLAALTASGGICAPPTPIYTLPDWETQARPVAGTLPAFAADRGGISLPHVNTVGDITDAITVIEADEDALGGTFATKSVQRIDCVDWTDYFVGAVAHRRQVGNLNSRTWPEGVAKEQQLTLTALARTAEGRLLDQMDALSVHVTGGAVYGASSTLLYRLQLSRVGIISRLRLPRDTRFWVCLPFWAAEMFSLDIVNNEEEGRFDTPQDQVGALLSRFGFDVVWQLDEGIAVGADAEVFEAQAAGVQVDWPGTLVIARLFPAGQFLRLDGGTMDFGIVRDSTLNETNDYELMGEIFERVARVGPLEAAHRLAITICPDGTRAPRATSGALTCSAS